MSKFLQLVGTLMASLKPPSHLTTNISAERYAKLRQFIVSEVTEELQRKLTPKIRAQVEQELKDEVLQDTRRKLEREIDEAKPNPRERRAFQMFVHNVELDAQAQATIASKDAESAERSLKRSRRWRTPLSYFLAVSALPLAYAAFHVFGPNLAFLVYALTFSIGFLLHLIGASSRHARLEADVEKNLKTASEFLMLAEQAKAYRVVHAERLSNRKELDALVKEVQEQKDRLDKEYNPKVSELEAARESLRLRVAVEEPTILMDEFDGRLEEAEARRMER